MKSSVMDLQKLLCLIRGMNTKEVSNRVTTYRTPEFNLLSDYDSSGIESKDLSETVTSVLADFGIKGTVEGIRRGPVVTRYEIKLGPGVKIAEIKKVADDIAIALMVKGVRIEAPIPGTALIGIEVSNSSISTIGLKQVLSGYDGGMQLPVAIGVDTCGIPKILDLSTMPHLLIAGQTGSGKSVCLNAIIISLIYLKVPSECQMVLVDPKRVELSLYRDIPNLWRPVITEAGDALEVFSDLISEMNRRYALLETNKVRNIKAYNELKPVEKLPYIVVVVDEMADLMMASGKELENLIVRLAQLSRAVGIHMVLATQKPVVKVITGLIKSNIPSRISFAVSSDTDSRVILDQSGAHRLIGHGDMLVSYPGLSAPMRLHGCCVSDAEVNKIVEALTAGG